MQKMGVWNLGLKAPSSSVLCLCTYLPPLSRFRPLIYVCLIMSHGTSLLQQGALLWPTLGPGHVLRQNLATL